MFISYETEKRGCTKKIKHKPDELSVKLAVSVIILIAAAVFRFYMPEEFVEASDMFDDSVDFVSAFNAVEAGISGEIKMKDAFKEACRYAFVGTDDNEYMVINIGEYIEKFKN